MIVVKALFYALPCYFANMVPVMVKKLPLLAKPLDAGRSWRGRRILGDHKTWRGLVFGLLGAEVIVALQLWVSHWSSGQTFKLVPATVNPWLLGFLLGLGALLGDSLKSFAKRRLGIASGRPWVPFDQLDFMVGALLLSSLVFWPGWRVALILLVITPLLHALTNLLAYWLKLKEVPW